MVNPSILGERVNNCKLSEETKRPTSFFSLAPRCELSFLSNSLKVFLFVQHLQTPAHLDFPSLRSNHTASGKLSFHLHIFNQQLLASLHNIVHFNTSASGKLRSNPLNQSFVSTFTPPQSKHLTNNTKKTCLPQETSASPVPVQRHAPLEQRLPVLLLLVRLAVHALVVAALQFRYQRKISRLLGTR